MNKLPTGEDIHKHVDLEYIRENVSAQVGYVQGASWMRDTYCRPLAEENEKLEESLEDCKKAFEFYLFRDGEVGGWRKEFEVLSNAYKKHFGGKK